MRNIDVCPECHYVLPFEGGRVFASPMAEHLGTNHNSTDTQRRIAEEVIVEISLSIEMLEEQISHLQRSRDTLKLHKAEHEVFLSKFRDFPPEVLGLIFQAYVDLCATRKEIVNSNGLATKPGDVRAMPSSSSRMHIPLILATVCKQWRMIALSMSSLWNNIHLSLGFRNLGMWEEIAPRSIRKAGQHPLYIDVDLEEWGNADKGRVILQTVGSRASHWREAQFLLSPITADLFKKVIAQLDGHLPELEYLGIGMSKESSPSFQLAAVPKLRAIQLINLGHNRLTLPWRQLQELSLIQIHWRDTLTLIQRCPNLISLHYEFVDDAYEKIVATKEIVVRHWNLSSLEVIASPRNFVFLNLLQLPALSSLAIVTPSLPVADYSLRTAYQFPVLSRFLSRSHCTLHELSLENMCLFLKDGAKLISLLPSLVILKLKESNSVSYHEILRLLAITEENDDDQRTRSTPPRRVLPLLRHLEYTYTSAPSPARGLAHPQITFEYINNVIKARSASTDEGSPVQRLRSVKVRGPRPRRHPENISAYRELLGFHCKELSVETYFSAPQTPSKVLRNRHIQRYSKYGMNTN